MVENPLVAQGVDVSELRDLYEGDEAARSFLDHAARRIRNMTETSVDRIQTLLRNEWQNPSRQDVIRVFRSLESAGCGDFVPGRRGYQSRFVWHVGLVSVGMAATGESEEIEELPDDAESEEADNVLRHVFCLRPDTSVELELPENLTSIEAIRLSEYIKTLPFGA